jgi:hypothetical protein
VRATVTGFGNIFDLQNQGDTGVPGLRLRFRLVCLAVYDIAQRRIARPKIEPQLESAVVWVRRKLGFEPDPQQCRVLSTEIKRGILNCTRQWGKSTVAAAKAVHQAWSVAESLTVVVSPSSRQSGELVRKAEDFVRRLGVKPKGDGFNEISIALPNGSRIVGLPGTEATIRGFSNVALLLVDEAARVSDNQYIAIRPMLAVSGGALWLMSTPCGKRGFFHDAWTRGAEWERFCVPATECARISARVLEEERMTMGERWFRQEYLCEFVQTESGVFDPDLVARAVSYDFEPLGID